MRQALWRNEIPGLCLDPPCSRSLAARLPLQRGLTVKFALSYPEATAGNAGA